MTDPTSEGARASGEHQVTSEIGAPTASPNGSGAAPATGLWGMTADQQKIFNQIVIGTVALFGSVFLVVWLFKAQTLLAGKWFVDTLGGFGMFLGYFLTDAFLVPIPNDTFTILGWLGGMSVLECTIWGSAGSIVGGFTGYAIGYHVLRHSMRAKALLGHGEGSMLQRVQRGGITIMVLAALTPLPYATGCWVAGTIEMPLKQVALISLLRIVKVGGYLWLFTQGIVSL